MGTVVFETQEDQLDKYKEAVIAVHRQEARRRIAARFGVPNASNSGNELVFKEMNLMARFLELDRKERKGAISAEEQTEAADYAQLKDDVFAIRAAENDAAEQIKAAATREEADAVVAVWPS